MSSSNVSQKKRLTLDWSKAISMDAEGYRNAPLRPFGSITNFIMSATFCTGSEYQGGCNQLGFSGYGVYKYPHGPIYRGNFKNGQFHGKGIITFPMGQQLMQGLWSKGRLLAFVYKFKDELLHDEFENYCMPRDRRFQCERLEGLNPAGFEQLTNDPIPKKLKRNCYDTVDGYYDATSTLLYGNDDEVIRVATEKERKEIEANYRYWKELPVGYKPELYETWTTGKRKTGEAKQSLDDYGLFSLFSERDDDG